MLCPLLLVLFILISVTFSPSFHSFLVLSYSFENLLISVSSFFGLGLLLESYLLDYMLCCLHFLCSRTYWYVIYLNASKVQKCYICWWDGIQILFSHQFLLVSLPHSILNYSELFLGFQIPPPPHSFFHLSLFYVMGP